MVWMACRLFRERPAARRELIPLGRWVAHQIAAAKAMGAGTLGRIVVSRSAPLNLNAAPIDTLCRWAPRRMGGGRRQRAHFRHSEMSFGQYLSLDGLVGVAVFGFSLFGPLTRSMTAICHSTGTFLETFYFLSVFFWFVSKDTEIGCRLFVVRIQIALHILKLPPLPMALEVTRTALVPWAGRAQPPLLFPSRVREKS